MSFTVCQSTIESLQIVAHDKVESQKRQMEDQERMLANLKALMSQIEVSHYLATTAEAVL